MVYRSVKWGECEAGGGSHTSTLTLLHIWLSYLSEELLSQRQLVVVLAAEATSCW